MASDTLAGWEARRHECPVCGEHACRIWQLKCLEAVRSGDAASVLKVVLLFRCADAAVVTAVNRQRDMGSEERSYSIFRNEKWCEKYPSQVALRGQAKGHRPNATRMMRELPSGTWMNAGLAHPCYECAPFVTIFPQTKCL
ncbi:hypothetical protein, unlikely [Trypanosoma congolense IL3000]|uniref:Uncharacterized protein n=1 Tax=Trypanosoma congolense (strain IL3000) TaxID=1068625 RepID=F9WAX3_TRYCI|nr:hypothetical protein, unlikely [Trypanosoma congolense IL3000]